MKIAFLTTGNPKKMKGFMNNVQERATRLKATGSLNIDFYMIRFKPSLIYAKIKGVKREQIDKTSQINSITYSSLISDLYLYDYLLTYRFKKRGVHCQKSIGKHVEKFKEYDLIVSHSHHANHLAYLAHKTLKIPYITSWHGSDINLFPFRSHKALELVQQIMENASLNHFVSKKLLEKSNEVTSVGRKEVFYTGPAKEFYKYADEEVHKIKSVLNLSDKKLVGFVGGLEPIKNVLVIPSIMQKVLEQTSQVHLLVIGFGELEDKLRLELDNKKVAYSFLGKIAPSRVAYYMNCLDILLLPSLNEGMPRVALEALACGVHVVGSDVGGIPEVVEERNTFALNEAFINNISNRIIQILEEKELPKELPKHFSWETNIDDLLNSYKEVIASVHF